MLSELLFDFRNKRYEPNCLKDMDNTNYCGHGSCLVMFWSGLVRRLQSYI